MSQVITVNVGGTGVNLGKASLELNTAEHGIGLDGYFKDEETAQNTGINNHVLFRENSIGQWTPRSIFIDNDPDSINSLLTSPTGELVGYD